MMCIGDVGDIGYDDEESWGLANSVLVVKFMLISCVAKLARMGGAAKFLVQNKLKARWF